MRTTKCYMMEESFSSSVICSLWWVKLQIDTTKLSSTKAISLWNKSCGRSLCCNKLSISTPGFRSLSLEVVQEPHVTLTRDIQELYFECLLVENVDDEVLAGTPLMGFNDIVVRPARRAFTLRGTLYEYWSSETKPPYTAVRSAVVFWAYPPSTTISPGEFLVVALQTMFRLTATTPLLAIYIGHIWYCVYLGFEYICSMINNLFKIFIMNKCNTFHFEDVQILNFLPCNLCLIKETEKRPKFLQIGW